MLSKIIDRPVLATVISLIIVILGVLGLSRLSITRFPDIAPPTIMVSGTYPGGNSETVIRSVVTPLEELINGVENMDYITSTASNDGSFMITIVFKQGVNPDDAAVNVQNRVQQASPILPEEVMRLGLTTMKQQNNMIMIFNIYTEDNELYDELFLQNYATINVLPTLKRIQGVGRIDLFGDKTYAIRVDLNPRMMALYNLEPADITAAIGDQSLESAPGKLGDESDAVLEYVIRYKGKKNLPEEYNDIIVKNDGVNIIRLKDVAEVRFSSITFTGDNTTNGKNAATIAILQAAGSNANAVETQIDKEIEKLSKAFPPGVKFAKVMSTKAKIDESIGQVQATLLEAFLLVFIVVLIFLQDWRSTIIPAIAVPVAIIGTFFFLYTLGFTINVLTLFALVLAIGIVVDDAIVVVEAVHGKMHHENMNAREATYSAMSEITGAVISITLVMSAVFVPIGFMTGAAGMFYKQFAYTLAIAIIISAVNALTLTPALCAALLKAPEHHEEGHKPKGFTQRFAVAFNTGFDNFTNKYIKSLQFLLKHKLISAVLIIAISIGAYWSLSSTSKSFVPLEDDGMFTYVLSMPPGTALDPTTAAANKINAILKDIEAVEANTAITGMNILSNSTSPAYAVGFVQLKERKDRGAIQDIDEIMNIVNEKLSVIKEGEVITFRMPPVDGYGVSSDAELILQDRMARSPQLLKAKAEEINDKLEQRPEIKAAYTMFRSDYPQLELKVDEDKAKQLGVSVSGLLNTVQMYFAGDQSLNFYRFGRFYRINLQVAPRYRMDEEALKEIYVRNSNGEMVPVNTLISLERVYGPESSNRYNLFNSLTINVSPAEGITSGKLMQVVEEELESLTPDYSYEWSGLNYEEKAAGNQSVIILGLCLLFVYLLLAAQYESYILPLAVLLSIPTGILGAFLGVKAVGLDNNIYVQVGLIMLIGLLAKNAILIVEFAVQRRAEGLSIIESALEGSKARLRPIIMTSLAFIAGMIPLMFAKGGMATGNKSISVSAAAGMTSGVILGVLVIPVLYALFQYIHEKLFPKKTLAPINLDKKATAVETEVVENIK